MAAALCSAHQLGLSQATSRSSGDSCHCGDNLLHFPHRLVLNDFVPVGDIKIRVGRWQAERLHKKTLPFRLWKRCRFRNRLEKNRPKYIGATGISYFYIRQSLAMQLLITSVFFSSWFLLCRNWKWRHSKIRSITISFFFFFFLFWSLTTPGNRLENMKRNEFLSFTSDTVRLVEITTSNSCHSQPTVLSQTTQIQTDVHTCGGTGLETECCCTSFARNKKKKANL